MRSFAVSLRACLRVPLALTSHDRHTWACRGLTLAQRDRAAEHLVRRGEAEYRVLKDTRFSGPANDAVVHLVVVGAPEPPGIHILEPSDDGDTEPTEAEWERLRRGPGGGRRGR